MVDIECLRIIQNPSSHFNDNKEKYQYLESLTEETIYSCYAHALTLFHHEEFGEDFNQYHRDAYQRLKLRCLFDKIDS